MKRKVHMSEMKGDPYRVVFCGGFELDHDKNKVLEATTNEKQVTCKRCLSALERAKKDL